LHLRKGVAHRREQSSLETWTRTRAVENRSKLLQEIVMRQGGQEFLVRSAAARSAAED
jgi:hypothetical protein